MFGYNRLQLVILGQGRLGEIGLAFSGIIIYKISHLLTGNLTTWNKAVKEKRHFFLFNIKISTF
jgi:hypothetical protein